MTFRPLAAFFGFRCGDKAGPAKPGEIGRMAIAVAGGERLYRRGLMVIAEDAGDGRKQYALAVRIGPVSEKQRMVAGRPVRA